MKTTSLLPGRIQGVADKSFLEDVSLSGDQLVISGEKREEKEERGTLYHRVERHWGSFQRVLPLPWDVAVKAQDLVRKIAVKAG